MLVKEAQECSEYSGTGTYTRYLTVVSIRSRPLKIRAWRITRSYHLVAQIAVALMRAAFGIWLGGLTLQQSRLALINPAGNKCFRGAGLRYPDSKHVAEWLETKCASEMSFHLQKFIFFVDTRKPHLTRRNS